MDMANEESYEEMINALQSFMSSAQEECSVMESAAADCVDNTGGDPAAEKASERLKKCVSDIRSALESIQEVISAMQDELERIREAAAKADSFD